MSCEVNRIVVWCERGREQPHDRVEFVFDRGSDGRWTSLWHESLGDPEDWDLVTIELERGTPWERLDGHLAVMAPDGTIHSRARGGVRRTKRGYELECPKCGGLYPVPFKVLLPVLDWLADNEKREIDVRELMRRVRGVSVASDR